MIPIKQKLFRGFNACFLMLFLANTGYAQTDKGYTLTMGPEYEDKFLALPPDIFGFDETGYYTFQTKAAAYVGIAFVPVKTASVRFYLKKFGPDLKLIKTNEVDFGDKLNDYQPLAAMKNKNNFFYFYSWKDTKKRSQILAFRTIDPITLEVREDEKIITEVSFDGFPRQNNATFEIVQSRDSSKLMVHYQLPNKPDSPERFGVHLFTSELIPLWNKEFELPYLEKLFNINEFKVDNEGNCYLLGKLYFERRKENDGDEPNYTFKILELNPSLDRPDETSINLPGKFLVDVHLDIMSNGDLICSGAYAQDRADLVKGVYYATLDGTTKVLKKESSQQLALDMFEADKGNGKPSGKKSFYRYDFKDLVLREDGGAVLIGEENYSYTVSTYNGRTYTYTTYYYRNDILVINIGPDGVIEATNRVNKSQVQANSTSLLSYGLAVTPSHLEFIFNDRVENLNISPSAKPVTYGSGIGTKSKLVVSCVSMDINGNQTRQSLFSLKETDLYAIPTAIEQVSKHDVLMVLTKGKYRRLVKITFD